jgi:two-component system, NtrC family, sensor kinase
MMNSVDFKLQERVKELNCLYELSKAARGADGNITSMVSKTIDILPRAMQHQAYAEVSIVIDGETTASRSFAKCVNFIEAPITIDKKVKGKVRVGYRKNAGKRLTFLREEKNLLTAIAGELSSFIKRVAIEADKEKLQIQLQHADRLAFVGELTAGIAHELNEPLGRILGFAQLIKKAAQLNGQQQEDLERIIKASLYTREIIKKLMIFSRQMPQQITAVNVNEVVENILYFIDVRFHSRGITITKTLDKNLSPIPADEVQVSQVLVNLITNAVHAMPKGGNITIATRNKGKYVMVSINDTGSGMTKAVRDKIFEPFFTTKAVGQGTGLGLSVVEGIINSHGGKINVESTPGKGSTFEILLPRKTAQ